MIYPILLSVMIHFGFADYPLQFRSDGCTGYFNGTSKEPNLWYHCCLEHDLFFWAGGNREWRKKIDLQLYQCVKDTGSPLHASIIYTGVKVGDLSPFKIKEKKWANAWGKQRKYEKLSAEEKILLIEYINQTHLSSDLLEKFNQAMSKN